MTISLDQAVGSFQPELPLVIAYSGGADSTALLVACAAKWPGQVGAIHVHHGLQAAADSFAAQCQSVCAGLGVALAVRRVDARHASGQSPEQAARRARYAALRAALDDGFGAMAWRSVALAQHADDQVETLLLALSRGAGLPGMASMPARWQRDGIVYYRPLLQVRGADIRSWLTQRSVGHVEDPSNADQGLTRNRIRALLLPALDAAFPQFRDTFARSAHHCAQSQALLVELARQDLELAAPQGPLLIARVQCLSRDRQANLLRHWLKSLHAVAPSAAQLSELLDQIAACSTRAHQIRIKVGGGFVSREGPALAWYNFPLDPGPQG